MDILILLRPILLALIALSLATAPIGAAIAQRHARQASPAAAVEMVDCAKMIAHKSEPTSSSNDCPCCDTKAACPPELCLTKCFKVFSVTVAPEALRSMVAMVLGRAEPLRPPDWSSGPLPPPPRA